MKSHEYADLFPMMATSDIARLAEDIRENGQADPIVTYEGKILDGRNRYQACLMVDVVPVFSEYEGTEPLAFVVSHNLHRRHLNESQRGMVGAKLANLQNGHRPPSAIALGQDPVTQKQAAEMLNIGVDSIKRSKTVLKSGIPELQDMQMSGEVSAKAASEVAKLPEEEQRKAVAGGVAGVKALAKKQSDSGTRSETSSESQEISHAEPKSDSSPKNQRVPKWIPDDARRLWLLAKTDLDKILKNDISRESTLREVIQYAQNRIDNNI
jgi:ParB-like chromosome segregation protein Spo0J